MNTPINGEWSKILDERLAEKKLTPAGLATLCGVDPTTVRRWRAKSSIPWSHIPAVVSATGLSVRVFFSDDVLEGRATLAIKATPRPTSRHTEDALHNAISPAGTSVFPAMSAAEVEETIAILFSPKDCETLDAVARESDDVPSRHSALLDALSSSEIYVDAEKVMAAGSTGSTDFLAEKGMVRATPTAQAPEPGVIMRRGRDAIAARASERQNVQTNKCQYIVSVPERGGPVQFCQTDGKPTPSIPGKSYCLAHANICYVGFRCQ